MTSSSERPRKSVMLQAEPGAGKTLLAQTMPGPILLFDTEGGSDHGLDIVHWREGEPVPTDLNPTTTVVRKHQDIRRLIEEVNRFKADPNHPFETIGLDSAHNAQNAAVREAQHWDNKGRPKTPDPNVPPSEADWGRSFSYMKELLELGMRDLATFEAAKPAHTVTIVGIDFEDMPHLPLLQPAVRRWVYYWFDLITFLYEDENSADGTRILQLNGNKDLCRVKCRLTPGARERLGNKLSNPHLGKIINVVVEEEVKAAEARKEQQ